LKREKYYFFTRASLYHDGNSALANTTRIAEYTIQIKRSMEAVRNLLFNPLKSVSRNPLSLCVLYQ